MAWRCSCLQRQFSVRAWGRRETNWPTCQRTGPTEFPGCWMKQATRVMRPLSFEVRVGGQFWRNPVPPLQQHFLSNLNEIFRRQRQLQLHHHLQGRWPQTRRALARRKAVGPAGALCRHRGQLDFHVCRGCCYRPLSHLQYSSSNA